MQQPFYLIIAGSRDFNDFDAMKKRVTEFINHLAMRQAGRKVVIVCGMARGADLLGQRYAVNNFLEVLEMPANWDKHGRGAGYRRNEEMVKVADAAIYFWDGQSRGTAHCMEHAKNKGIPYAVVVGQTMRLENMAQQGQFEAFAAVEL